MSDIDSIYYDARTIEERARHNPFGIEEEKEVAGDWPMSAKRYEQILKNWEQYKKLKGWAFNEKKELIK